MAILTQTIKERRKKLNLLRSYIDEMIEINQNCSRIEKDMLTQGYDQGEIISTLNKSLDTGGPFGWDVENQSQADFSFDGIPDIPVSRDTLSDRAINLLMSYVAENKPIIWTHGSFNTVTGQDITEDGTEGTEGTGVTGTAGDEVIVPTGVFGFAGTVRDQVFSLGKQLEPIILPAAVNGVGTVTYSLDPNPPVGIILVLASRTLTGRPNTVTERVPYLWTAKDATGATISLSFGMTVLDGEVSLFRFQNILNATSGRTYTSNTIEVAGISRPVAASVRGGEMIVNGDVFTGETVAPSDNVAVRLTASSGYNAIAEASVQIGSRIEKFSITTQRPVYNRFDFELANVDKAQAGHHIISNSFAY